MAQFYEAFDASTVDPTGGYQVFPPGDYQVHIIASEMKPTKNGDGEYLSLELEILDGEFAGQKIYDRLNLNNQNQTTVDIARRTLSQICHATGVMQLTDSEHLHFKPMLCKVTVAKRKDNGEDTNRFTYKPLGQQPQRQAAPVRQAPAPAARPVVAQQAAPAAAQSTPVPAWRQRKTNAA